jgi:5S rRNA maturation endonuclease (ribonuclease M5)
MTIKHGLQFFFFELTDNDNAGQKILAGIVRELNEQKKKLYMQKDISYFNEK